MSIQIQVQNLSKRFIVGRSTVYALKEVSFTIAKGEVCCIIGPSGSGKSTLLNMLAGLEKPTSGSIHMYGHNIAALSENQLAILRQKKLGFIFQSYNLLPQLTALENVALPLTFSGCPTAQRTPRAAALLKQMGLAARMHHSPGQMSGGQQQRVGIARAFVSSPDIVFADEPTGNLDTATTKSVLSTVLHHCQTHQITFIMVTHETELSRCADRIITMRDGKILTNLRQTPSTVLANRTRLLAIQGEENT